MAVPITKFERQGAHVARLEWQLASLAIRFGADRVLRAVTADTEAVVAERRFEWQDAGVDGAGMDAAEAGT